MEVLARMGLSGLFRARSTAGAGCASGCPVTVVNHGAGAIAAVFARPFGTRDWGPDLLGGKALPPGRTGELRTTRRSGARRWDVFIEFSCGAGHFLRGIDLSDERHIGVSEFGVRTF